MPVPTSGNEGTMTRYLLNEPEQPGDPAEVLSWTCLEPECGETVTDLEQHTTQRHRSDHITVFTSKAALAAARFEEQKAGAINALAGRAAEARAAGADPITRYADHFKIPRREAKSRLFAFLYGAAAAKPGHDIHAIVDDLIAEDIRQHTTEETPHA